MCKLEDQCSMIDDHCCLPTTGPDDDEDIELHPKTVIILSIL